MSEFALPCIACGVVLPNVDKQSENQPDGGCYFTTHGMYGSTVFDPMDGHFLEITVCDECLVKAGEQQRVLAGRDKRPVVIDRPDRPEAEIVGWEHVHRPLVPWHQGLSGYGEEDQMLLADESEIGGSFRDQFGRDRIEWTPSATRERDRRAAVQP